MDSYKLLVRILIEQCNVTKSGNEAQIEVKIPKDISSDSLYSSDENCQKAGKLGVKVISHLMGRKKEEDVNPSDFQFSERGETLMCPAGNSPEKTHVKKSRYCACFNKKHCSKCDIRSGCPIKEGKKFYYLRYTDKELRIAIRRTYEDTEEFIDRYRLRAGVEATISEYNRKTGVKQLRVRGPGNVQFAAVLKATTINIFRATAIRKAIIGADIKIFAKNYIFSVIKEPIFSICDYFIQFLLNFMKIHNYDCFSQINHFRLFTILSKLFIKLIISKLIYEYWQRQN